MRANAFLKLVGQMMDAQQEYFKSRTQSALVNAKALERQVREVVRAGQLEPDEPVTVEPSIHQENLFTEQP